MVRYSKKAQFFLVGAIIVATVILGLTSFSTTITTVKGERGLSGLSDEIDREGRATIVDKLSTSTTDPSMVIEPFIKDIIDYGKTQRPNTQYFFVYADLTKVMVFGYGDRPKFDAKLGGDAFIFTQDLSDANFWMSDIKTQTPPLDIPVTVKFYSENYDYTFPLDAEARTFSHLVRMEDEGGLYVAQ